MGNGRSRLYVSMDSFNRYMSFLDAAQEEGVPLFMVTAEDAKEMKDMCMKYAYVQFDKVSQEAPDICVMFDEKLYTVYYILMSSGVCEGEKLQQAWNEPDTQYGAEVLARSRATVAATVAR